MAFDGIKHVHGIGIGGIGVSALMRYFLSQGIKVSGSDTRDSGLLDELRQEGVEVFIGHDANNIPDNTDLIVYSPAIVKENPERKAAKKRGILSLSYPQAVGKISEENYTIAVAGTHGKSTITAMIALLLTNGGLDPTVIIGTKMKEFENRNFRAGKSNFFVLEACEYQESFLQYHPSIVVIPNIDLDHMDFFKTEKNYVQAFTKFIKKLPHSGFLIANGDDERITSITKKTNASVLPLHFHEYSFQMEEESFPYPSLQVFGKHNRENASLVFILGKILNIPEDIILKTLFSFTGTWRRMEEKGMLKTGVQLITDYAHHPTEIQATLQAVREKYKDKKIIAVFQPHQYSRTKRLFSDFIASFSQADEIIIPNIFAARDESNVQDMNVSMLVDGIAQYGKKVRDGEGIEKTAQYILEHTNENDVVITMGAGDINRLYEFWTL